MKTTKRSLIATLGLGRESLPERYEPVVYTWEGKPAPQARVLVQQALVDLLGPFEAATLLGTKTVKTVWLEGDSPLLREHFKAEMSFREVPEGKSIDEQWSFFEAVRSLLDEHKALGVDEIVVDLTHGFRAQSMVALSAVVFWQSEQERIRNENVPQVTLTYGAYEARENNEVSIWDLTELLTAGQWNGALNALALYGRADSLVRICDQTAKRWLTVAQAQGRSGRQLGVETFPTRLGKLARAFADDVVFSRVENLLSTTAGELRQALESPDAVELSHRIPPLRGSFEWLSAELAKLTFSSNVKGALLTEDGVRSSLALAEFYEKLERYSELAALLRETVVTWMALRAGQSAGGLDGKVDGNVRNLAEGLMAQAANRAKSSDSDADKLAMEIRNVRNDVQHCGLNASPSPAKTLRAQLTNFTERLSNVMAHDSAQEGQPPPIRPVFINLSNHAVSSWNAPQLEGAQALGHGEPADLEGGLPMVDPDADRDTVRKQAKALAKQARSQGADGAFVAGEFTLTVALVEELQALGVRCYTATTARRVSEVPQPDGGTLRQAEFRFVRWREY